TRLHQVVANLLTNAIKFTPAGVRVTLQAGPGPDGRAQVVVGDTGVGIPPDELPHIFDRFWRGSSAGRVTGTGIGLAVVAELVAAHGGEVEATSQPGSGTRIVVELPQP
ncbi:MAG: sensor histidine kinase, partial [Acidimicrobiales bacterium]